MIERRGRSLCVTPEVNNLILLVVVFLGARCCGPRKFLNGANASLLYHVADC